MSIIQQVSDIQKQIKFYRKKLVEQRNVENYIHPKYLCHCISIKCTGKCGCIEMPKEPPSEIPNIEKKIKESILQLIDIVNNKK